MSDLDQVIPDINWTVDPDDDPAGLHQEYVEETGELIDLLDWVWDQRAGFDNLLVGVQPRRIGDVQMVWCGPDALRWGRYRRALAAQRRSGRTVKRNLANSISVTCLLRYGEHAVWLLADLTVASLKMLPARIRESGILAAEGDVRATILKVPHHGAKNGCYAGLDLDLLRCAPEDIVVISAAGGILHPAASVLNYWRATGKRVTGTYSSQVAEPGERFGGWGWDVLDSVASPSRHAAAQDVIVRIPEHGAIAVERHAVD